MQSRPILLTQIYLTTVVSLERSGSSILKKIHADHLELIQFHAKLILAVDAVDKRSVQNAPLSFKVFDFSSVSPGLEKQTNQRKGEKKKTEKISK